MMHPNSMLRATIAVAVFFIWACQGGVQVDDAHRPEPAPTWHGETAALITTHCAGCHRDGGAAPFALDSYAAAAPFADAIVDSVKAGRMPPWNPDPDCRTFVDQRVLPPGALSTLQDWAAAGAPEGIDTGTPRPEPPANDFEANLVTQADAPYLPDASTPDDYRCLVLDAEFAEDTFVRGLQVVPDQGPLVHHALIYAIPPADVPELLALDAMHPGTGYPCFGGVEVGLPTTQGGWVPGQGASVWPGDRATFIQAGSRLVMQVHYNLGAAPAAPDQTQVHLMTRAEPTAEIVAGQPLATFDLHIPAGDPAAQITREFTWHGEEDFELVGVAGHMHLLGTRMSVEIVRNGGDECVLDIPKWDFAWQEMFVLQEPVSIQPGDRVRISCTFDNSMANQPVINGEQLVPQDVEWGEGTLDEMCYASLIRSRPWSPALSGRQTCAGLADCRAECDAPDSLACVARCVGEDRSCAQCTVGALAMCGGAACLRPFNAARSCLTDCLMFSGNPDACMAQTCAEVYAELDACLVTATAEGGCVGVAACER